MSIKGSKAVYFTIKDQENEKKKETIDLVVQYKYFLILWII